MDKKTELVIQITGVKKRYRLGVINSRTLKGDFARFWAKITKKTEKYSKIGQKKADKNKIFYALNGVDLQVYRGEKLGIIGCNGAGKTTLLKLLTRITSPTQGEIKIKGKISSMLEVGTGFSTELTGRENIYLNGAILGMSKREITEKLESIIDFSECREYIDTPVKRYSTGMYVKLAFAVAVYLNSEIVVMDEVLAVGDVAFQQKCIEKIPPFRLVTKKRDIFND